MLQIYENSPTYHVTGTEQEGLGGIGLELA